MALLNSRYARYSTLVLVVLGLLLIQILFSPVKSIKQGELFRSKSSPALTATLVEEEARYHIMLQDREDLVRKWGPRPEDIRP